jgi:Cytochrome P450
LSSRTVYTRWPIFLIEVPSGGRDNLLAEMVKGNGQECEASLNSDPREKPKEQQTVGPNSGNSTPDDSNSPDEEVLRLPTPASLTPTLSEWLTPTPSGEKMVTKEEETLSSSRDRQTLGEIDEWMTDLELHDELMTLLVAGHETIATALAWALYHVLRHPEVYTKIRDELDLVVGEGPIGREQAVKLKYLEAAIKETLRLTPVIPLVGRQLQAAMTIGEWNIPAGVVVAPCIYLVRRHPTVWPHPTRFEPERFVDNTPGAYEWLPFGGGTRHCIGMAFALYEMKIVLAEIFRRSTLRLAPKYRAKVKQRSITFTPSGGIPIVAESKRTIPQLAAV